MLLGISTSSKYIEKIDNAFIADKFLCFFGIFVILLSQHSPSFDYSSLLVQLPCPFQCLVRNRR